MPISCSVQGLRIGFPMVRLTVPECDKEPLVAVTVKGYLPDAAVPGVTIKLDEPVPTTEVGLKEDEAPEGTPLTLNETAPLKPLVPTTDIAYVTFEPEGTAVGATESMKSCPLMVLTLSNVAVLA